MPGGMAMRAAAACLLCAGAARGAEAPAPSIDAEKVRELVAAAARREPTAPSVLASLDPRKAADRELARRLRTVRLSVEWDRLSADEALASLRERTGLACVLSASAREALARESPKISLHLRDLALGDLLYLLAAQLGDYRFAARHGILLLVRGEEHRPAAVLKIYDIRAITAPRRDFPGPRLSLATFEEAAPR